MLRCMKKHKGEKDYLHRSVWCTFRLPDAAGCRRMQRKIVPDASEKSGLSSLPHPLPLCQSPSLPGPAAPAHHSAPPQPPTPTHNGGTRWACMSLPPPPTPRPLRHTTPGTGAAKGGRTRRCSAQAALPSPDTHSHGGASACECHLLGGLGGLSAVRQRPRYRRAGTEAQTGGQGSRGGGGLDQPAPPHPPVRGRVVCWANKAGTCQHNKILISGTVGAFRLEKKTDTQPPPPPPRSPLLNPGPVQRGD